MRAILDLRTRKVLRNCGSISSSIRTFAMLQMDKSNLCRVRKECGLAPPVRLNYKLAICELSTTRHIGDVVPEGEFTIIHQEK